MKPISVNYENKDKVFKNVYGFSSLRNMLKALYSLPKYKIGDKVRTKYIMKHFDRGYYPNWSDQIFTICGINMKKHRILYKIKV